MKLELANLKVEMLHHDPIVYTVEGIISDSECKHFIETSSKKVRRSLVSGFDQEKNKRGLLDNRRTSSSCWISHIHDEITALVALPTVFSIGSTYHWCLSLPLSDVWLFPRYGEKITRPGQRQSQTFAWLPD